MGHPRHPVRQEALDDNEIGGQEIKRSPFLPDIRWLVPETVATCSTSSSRAAAATGGGEPTGPGLHGTGIDATSYGDTTLQPGVTNRLTYAPNQPFVVNFTNHGENDEFDIRVTLRIHREGGDPITMSKTVPKLAPQASATVELPPTKQPPIGAAVTIRVKVAKVPGEEKVDNNRSEYPALFERG